MFGLFQVVFSLVFLMISGMFVVILIRSIAEWNRNNHSPRLSVPAVVVSKRMQVTHHHNEHHHTSTSYYVTFEVNSGDRMEFRMSGGEYGLLIEQDEGTLHFQGTRYLGFEREYEW